MRRGGPSGKAIPVNVAKQDLTPSGVFVPRVVPTDPDDDHVIACALAARADAIVSGDRDLLELGQHQGIAILKASDALKRFG
ncbi:MAG: PIN domain-containing protein [Xanthomonadales bacterium]|nr:PIN domain-containing protein [Xanthomonadales bacterium]